MRDSLTGQFLAGPKLCTCGSGECQYHQEANLRSKEKHREKRRAEARAYYWANREKMRNQNRVWVRQNRDFVRRRSTLRRRSGARLKKQEYQDVMDYYSPTCVYCGCPTTGIDHLIPLARGGAGSDFFNLVPCCPPCNSIKGTRPIWVMLGQKEVMKRVAA